MKNSLFVTLLAFVLIGCSGKSQKQTKTSLNLKAGFDAATVNQFPGGIMVYGKHIETGKVEALRVISEADSFDLDNGTWHFSTIAYKGATPFTGEHFCENFGPVNINGPDPGAGTKTINIILNKAKCDDPFFSPNEFRASQQFLPLIVGNCSDISGGAITASGDNCSGNLGDAQGLKLELVASPGRNSLMSDCIDLSAASSGKLQTNLFFPLGNNNGVIKTAAVLYEDSSCSEASGVKPIIFDNGMTNGSIGEFADQTNIQNDGGTNSYLFWGNRFETSHDATSISLNIGSNAILAGVGNLTYTVSSLKSDGSTIETDYSSRDVLIGVVDLSGTVLQSEVQTFVSGVYSGTLSLSITGSFNISVLSATDSYLTLPSDESVAVTTSSADNYAYTTSTASLQAGDVFLVNVEAKTGASLAAGINSGIINARVSGPGLDQFITSPSFSSGLTTLTFTAGLLTKVGAMTVEILSATTPLTYQASSALAITHAPANNIVITMPSNTFTSDASKFATFTAYDIYNNVANSATDSFDMNVSKPDGTTDSINLTLATGIHVKDLTSYGASGPYNISMSNSALIVTDIFNYTVTHGPATHLSFLTPTAAGPYEVGNPFQMDVAIRDIYNNTVTSDNSTFVSVSLAGGTFGSTATAGVSSFPLLASFLDSTQTVSASSNPVLTTDLKNLFFEIDKKAITEIAAGGDHTCVINNGGVQCWGDNTFGQLGNGTNSPSFVPTAGWVNGLGEGSGVTGITAGANHTCAVVKGGAKCWGQGTSGQLGNSANSNNFTPVTPTGLGDKTGVRKIVAGVEHTCAIVGTGVMCWGRDTDGAIGINSNPSGNVHNFPKLNNGSYKVSDIAASNYSTCIISDSTLMCWGQNTNGTLANGTLTFQKTPFAATGIGVSNRHQKISGGGDHFCSLAASEAGEKNVRCWGLNDAGQLGDTTLVTRLVETSVFDTGGHTPFATEIATGENHSCAIMGATIANKVFCWGLNNKGQLGLGNLTDVAYPNAVSNISTLDNVTKIAAGNNHTCAIVNGGVKCWGENVKGQLGSGDTIGSSIPKDVLFFGKNFDITKIAAGVNHSCMIKQGGAFCWGNGLEGKLGHGTETGSATPIAVSTLPVGSGVTDIAVGENNTCAVVRTGLKCWGQGDESATGQAVSIVDQLIPVDVAGVTAGSGATKVVVGTNHACAIVDNGVKCWGKNDLYQLGDGTQTNSGAPVSPPTVGGVNTGVTSLSTKGNTTCAIKGTNHLYCWGDNGNFQLGNGGNSVETGIINTLTGGSTSMKPISVAVGINHNCATYTNNTTTRTIKYKCWGEGADNKLGTGSNSDVQTAPNGDVPGSITGNVVPDLISLGTKSTCFASEGKTACLGDNADNQLAIPGGSANYASPVVGSQTSVTSISSGDGYGCIIDAGIPKCFGKDDFGETGTNSPGTDIDGPLELVGY